MAVEDNHLRRIRGVVVHHQLRLARPARRWVELDRDRTQPSDRERRSAGGIARIDREIGAALNRDTADSRGSAIPPRVEQESRVGLPALADLAVTEIELGRSQVDRANLANRRRRRGWGPGNRGSQGRRSYRGRSGGPRRCRSRRPSCSRRCGFGLRRSGSSGSRGSCRFNHGGSCSWLRRSCRSRCSRRCRRSSR